MFGGSLYCGAVLAGWGWLHLSLRDAGIEDGHIVIQEGHISYPLPVTQDAIVLCDAPTQAAWNKFLAMYARHGRARLSLNTRVINAEGQADAVKFNGLYVLHR